MRAQFYAGGKLITLNMQSMESLAASTPKLAAATRSMTAMSGAKVTAAARRSRLWRSHSAVKSQTSRFAGELDSLNESDTRYAMGAGEQALLVVTDSIIVEGASQSEIKWLRDTYGLTVVREGKEGKCLLRSDEGGDAGIRRALEAAKKAWERRHVRAAHPNFVRFFQQPKPSTAGDQPFWNHDNTGNPGLPGSDVAAKAAWIITQGEPEVRVAVLDEGVDTLHPSLKAVVIEERDFVDQNPHARPDGDDAHGTACAGIVLSQDNQRPGLAPRCSLVAVRIAKGGQDGWVFDDFATADAIDWAWNEGKADVLSNSWGGGPPVDAITNAIIRARTQGRKGKGSVVVFAAGNGNVAVSYPGTLDIVCTVGASNQWDERKSPQSRDGEKWWGSCFGPSLDLVAPGVKISTTDIRGARGYAPGDSTDTFNGTSSATPHVAAAAALILSIAPRLTEARVRQLLAASVDRLTADGKWNKFTGNGRLNIFSALRLARR
jgi:thermitase